MKGWIASVVFVSSVAAAAGAYAQEAPAGPGKVEVTIIPGGAMFVTSKGNAPKFDSYDAGAAVSYNFNRMVGVEGELAGSFGWKQNLDQFNGLAKEKTPNMLGYSGNVVANFPGHLVVPYAAGGIGGTRLYRRAVLDIFDTTTLFTGNVGGGAKWFASGGRWGLRADYRFLATKSNDDAPEFFGREKRFGHRIYGGVVINAVK